MQQAWSSVVHKSQTSLIGACLCRECGQNVTLDQTAIHHQLRVGQHLRYLRLAASQPTKRNLCAREPWARDNSNAVVPLLAVSLISRCSLQSRTSRAWSSSRLSSPSEAAPGRSRCNLGSFPGVGTGLDFIALNRHARCRLPIEFVLNG